MRKHKQLFFDHIKQIIVQIQKRHSQFEDNNVIGKKIVIIEEPGGRNFERIIIITLNEQFIIFYIFNL